MLPKRTKQTARKSTGGWAPGGQLSSNPTYFQTLPSAGAGIKRSPGPVYSTSAQRPAKRQVPAPRRSSRIGGTGQSANLAHAFELTALKAQLKLRQDAHDREQVDLNRRQAQLNREAAALHARRVQETRPLKAQIGELQSYFKLNRATRLQTLVRLRIPSALPYFFGGLRISSGLALIGAVVAEFVAGSGGTGTGLAYQILQAGYELNIPRMFAALLLITVTGVLLFALMSVLSKWALAGWHESETSQE